jgi:hypothetical protein
MKYGFVLLPKQKGREQKVMFLEISKATFLFLLIS